MRSFSLLSYCVALVAMTFMVPAVAEEPHEAHVAAPRSSGDPANPNWWDKRHADKLKAKDAADKVDLVLIGDSITHGFEGAGKETFKKYYADRNTLNLGFSGDRTEHVLWRLEHGEVDGIHPKLVVMMIGTNNTGHRQDAPEITAKGIRMILDQLRTRLPEAKILLLGVFPRSASVDDSKRKINDGINDIIATYDDGEMIHFLNINDKFLEEDGTLSKEIMPDLLHPKQKGYGIWAEAIEPKVKELMGE
ncbi:GDSL-type esterase/lipase family protein [Calycomorphotria hydatis]|uniref:GDSL-like Lipase/Acylhydrolase n=1 Tax=Calycomorphotria hydatis TaxID=2528027 RepID=A0A517T7Q6_9PLAN|nr:GDSL-type esterase/lipase family protein [Calycomorphotria hydatis]QDT64408.1 GDSL-like Lipase/Acylhydrolase [Calycomorphotria hydatis]